MKKIVSSVLIAVMLIMVFACNKVSNSSINSKGIKVGISMPTNNIQRWEQGGEDIKKQLEKLGYEVDLQYADDNSSTQINQIENMITNGVKVLVIVAVDGSSLNQTLSNAKENGIYVIAYDRLIMNSNDVDYYVTFNLDIVGMKQGEYIRDKLNLDNEQGPFNIEIFAGDLADNNSIYYYDEAMKILKPYIESGKLKVLSNDIKREEVSVLNWKTIEAQNRMESIITTCYSNGEKIDAVLCPNDSIALGVTNAIEMNYNGELPIITGQDCDILNVKNIISGKQSMSVFKDIRDLDNQAVNMIKTILEGGSPIINDTETYNNGVKVIPAYLCLPAVVTKDNYKEILIDTAYYTENQLK